MPPESPSEPDAIVKATLVRPAKQAKPWHEAFRLPIVIVIGLVGLVLIEAAVSVTHEWITGDTPAQREAAEAELDMKMYLARFHRLHTAIVAEMKNHDSPELTARKDELFNKHRAKALEVHNTAIEGLPEDKQVAYIKKNVKELELMLDEWQKFLNRLRRTPPNR